MATLCPSVLLVETFETTLLDQKGREYVRDLHLNNLLVVAYGTDNFPGVLIGEGKSFKI